MYYNSIKYYYPALNVYFFDEWEIKNVNNEVFDNSIVFCSPTHLKYETYIYGKNTYYIFHLDNFNNVGYTSKEEFYNDNIIENLLKNINNHIVLSCRKNDNINYLEENIEEKEICLPWFSDKLYDELLYIKNNLKLFYNNIREKKYIAYFGSIWNENINIILELIEICIKKKIYLLLKGRIFGITNNEKNIVSKNSSEFITFIGFDYKNNDVVNSFDYINEKYGIKCLLSLQGSRHNNSYISNRIFESVTNGYIGVTNNEITKQFYNSSIYNSNIDNLLDEVQNILCDEKKWCDVLLNQLNEFIEKFYSYNNITSCINLLKNVCMKNNEIITLDNQINSTTYQIWFCSTNYNSKYFYTIMTNDDIIEKIKNKQDLIINLSNYKKLDIFLVNQLILNNSYDVYIDNDFPHLEYIKKICDKNNINYNLKNKLNINSLVSGQRCGSTLIIDILQKLSKNTLALSEIFCCSEQIESCSQQIEIYSSSYDVCNNYGILKNFNLLRFDGNNIKEYFQQFVDLAIYKNKTLLLFKLTIDFSSCLENVYKLNEIMSYISQFKLIYLKRDINSVYISKKLAEEYGYSNTLYEYPEKKIFSNYELCMTKLNAIEFENIYLKNLDYTTITYESIIHENNNMLNDINTLLNTVNKTNIQYVNIIEKNIFEAHKKDYINIKQNVLDINILNNEKYWCE